MWTYRVVSLDFETVCIEVGKNDKSLQYIVWPIITDVDFTVGNVVYIAIHIRQLYINNIIMYIIKAGKYLIRA